MATGCEPANESHASPGTTARALKSVKRRERKGARPSICTYVTVKSDGADGARSRNNSAICAIARNPNAGEEDTINARARRYCYEIVECEPRNGNSREKY